MYFRRLWRVRVQQRVWPVAYGRCEAFEETDNTPSQQRRSSRARRGGATPPWPPSLSRCRYQKSLKWSFFSPRCYERYSCLLIHVELNFFVCYFYFLLWNYRRHNFRRPVNVNFNVTGLSPSVIKIDSNHVVFERSIRVEVRAVKWSCMALSYYCQCADEFHASYQIDHITVSQLLFFSFLFVSLVEGSGVIIFSPARWPGHALCALCTV